MILIKETDLRWCLLCPEIKKGKSKIYSIANHGTNLPAITICRKHLGDITSDFGKLLEREKRVEDV